jgi:hypothetical protein
MYQTKASNEINNVYSRHNFACCLVIESRIDKHLEHAWAHDAPHTCEKHGSRANDDNLNILEKLASNHTVSEHKHSSSYI